MLVIFAIGIIVSPILTWAFDVSGWLWGMSWLITGFSLALILFEGSVAAAGIVTGIVACPLLTWGFDVHAVIWIGAWAITGMMMLGAFIDGPTAFATGVAGFLVLLILVGIFGDGDEKSRTSNGFTEKESDCIQYKAMGYNNAYQTNNCDEVLSNAR